MLAGVFAACNDDDDTPPVVTPSVTSSTFKLTSLNSSVQTDLNQDGTPSISQLSETTCFDNMVITLRSDHTFSASSKGVYLNEEVSPATVDCYNDADYTGTWSQTNDEVTLHYVDTSVTPNETYDDVYNISSDGRTLSVIATGVDYLNYSGGAYVPLTTDLEFIYTKQ